MTMKEDINMLTARWRADILLHLLNREVIYPKYLNFITASMITLDYEFFMRKVIPAV
jgi:hypothetical protein